MGEKGQRKHRDIESKTEWDRNRDRGETKGSREGQKEKW
jgi:hypothetical protein